MIALGNERKLEKQKQTDTLPDSRQDPVQVVCHETIMIPM